MTTGRIYQSVIERERNLEYGGKCVEVVPHIPEEIIRRINSAVKATNAEIAIIELGGTIGEYQNLIFLEAARMMHRKNPRDVSFVLVSYLPIPSKVGEMKTKLTQTATRELNSCGIQPDFILCRAEKPIDDKRREKLATFCSIEPENAISAPDVNNIYEIPINFENEKLGDKILKQLHIKPRQKDLVEWRAFIDAVNNAKKEVKIGIVGKYFETGDYVLSDSYISVIESVKIAAWTQGFCPKFTWLSSDVYEEHPEKLKELSQLDGVIVPGGFGSRGIEGKISVAKYCRENKIPYFGLCYGMQIATIEFARNVCKLKDAHTEEINPATPYPVIHIMPEQKSKLRHKDYGGSMRLGEYACQLQKGTKAEAAYHDSNFPVSADKVVMERHRHRYEVNNDFRKQLEKCGLVIAGVNPERDLVEIIEIKDHPFMVGTQFHPEFDSRPLRPQPLFKAFIKAAGKRHNG
jgi:CTP synthase